MTNVTSSIWFRRLVTGCKLRMDQVHKPNLALPTELIVTLLQNILTEIQGTDSEREKFDLIIFGSFIVIEYVLSL